MTGITHVQIKLGNSFSLSFQNMVLGSLCTTWLCSDYLLLQFLSTSADALSSRPSSACNSTEQHSTTGHRTPSHKTLSSHTPSLSLELPNRTHEIWTNYENIPKIQERPRRIQEHCVTLSVTLSEGDPPSQSVPSVLLHRILQFKFLKSESEPSSTCRKPSLALLLLHH